MKKVFVLLLLFVAVDSFAQQAQLPIGTCGIVNVYDAAGNRIRRVFFCNNGIDPYPLRQAVNTTESKNAITEKNETAVVQEVDALYPNPTTGKFFVTFSKTLTNANVSITDNMGKVLAQFKGTGNRVEFDLAPYAAGMYFIRIEQDGNWVTKKVIKQ
jgi:hypothetical protein